MRIAIFGAQGQLGSALARVFDDHEVTPITHDDCDIADYESVMATVYACGPQLILNAAAMTQVDLCESEVDRAFAVNAMGPRNLALAAGRLDAELLHLSADYVFEGTAGRAYDEWDEPWPLSVFGRSKLAGEREVLSRHPRSYIARSGVLYSAQAPNFAMSILDAASHDGPLQVVGDQIGSPTYVPHLAVALRTLVLSGRYGLYHVAGTGECSRADLARALLTAAGDDADRISDVSTEVLASSYPAPRPLYAALECRAWRTAGFDPLPPWEEGVRELLSEVEPSQTEATPVVVELEDEVIDDDEPSGEDAAAEPEAALEAEVEADLEAEVEADADLEAEEVEVEDEPDPTPAQPARKGTPIVADDEPSEVDGGDDEDTGSVEFESEPTPLMNRVVVTGGAGFLGSHLCERLFSMGAEVVCIDNLLTGHMENLKGLIGRPGFTFMHCNVSNYVHVPGNVDAVLHFASPASPQDYLEYPIQTLKVGALGTHHMLGVAKTKGARFMTASTSEVYGDPLVSPQTEQYWGNVNPVGPRGVYDEAKRFAEALTMAYHRTHGVEVRMPRIFNVYGPRLRVDGRVVSNFIHQALTGEDLTIFGDGTQTRSFCYVEDEVDGLIGLLLSDHNGPCNVGNPHEFTVLELAELVLELTGADVKIRHEALPEDDPKQRRPDISLARDLFGWEPKVALRDGLARTIDWYRTELEARGRIGGSGDPDAALR